MRFVTLFHSELRGKRWGEAEATLFRCLPAGDWVDEIWDIQGKRRTRRTKTRFEERKKRFPTCIEKSEGGIYSPANRNKSLGVYLYVYLDIRG